MINMSLKIQKILERGFVHGTGGYSAKSERDALGALADAVEALAREVDATETKPLMTRAQAIESLVCMEGDDEKHAIE